MPDATKPLLHVSPQRRFIRSQHPFHFRSGEWAEIVGTAYVNDQLCYEVIFPDGVVDTWVVSDPVAEWEFSGIEECAR